MTHSFTTRRSSDLRGASDDDEMRLGHHGFHVHLQRALALARDRDRHHAPTAARLQLRSEEHTSELQSLMRTSYAVFSLKKKYDIIIPYFINYRHLIPPINTNHHQ